VNALSKATIQKSTFYVKDRSQDVSAPNLVNSNDLEVSWLERDISYGLDEACLNKQDLPFLFYLQLNTLSNFWGPLHPEKINLNITFPIFHLSLE